MENQASALASMLGTDMQKIRQRVVHSILTTYVATRDKPGLENWCGYNPLDSFYTTESAPQFKKNLWRGLGIWGITLPYLIPSKELTPEEKTSIDQLLFGTATNQDPGYDNERWHSIRLCLLKAL